MAARPQKTWSSANRRPTWSRRRLLEIGGSSVLGLSVAGLAALADANPTTAGPTRSRRAKRVLFVFLFGGPSQLETFDPKPDAPAEYRGEFGVIGTGLPGVHFCEHLPLLAQRTSRFALVRTLGCNPNFGDHRLAVHGMLGGINELPAGATLAASRRDWPCFASVVEYLREPRAGLPNSVVLPGELIDPGTGLYPGQNAGLLGARFDPYRIDQDPNSEKYAVDASLRLPEGLSLNRMGAKRQLLAEIDRQRAGLDQALETLPYSVRQREAFGVLTSGRLAEALALDQEPAALRERYGRHLFGQTLLLARRLLEAEVPIVQANLGYHALWDTHYNNFVALRGLLPPFDQALSTLFDDLAERGMLEETLVVVTGEFGRTPKLVPATGSPSFFTNAGRDHWMACFSGLFAGAGVQGSQVIGRSDGVAAYPITKPYTPCDVGATVYGALGIASDTQLRDIQGRPLVLNQGQAIGALYSGTG